MKFCWLTVQIQIQITPQDSHQKSEKSSLTIPDFFPDLETNSHNQFRDFARSFIQFLQEVLSNFF